MPMAVKVEKLVKKFSEKSTILLEKVYDTHFFDTREKDMLISVVEYDYKRSRIEKVLSAKLDDEELWHSFCLFLNDALDKKATDRRPDANNFKNINLNTNYGYLIGNIGFSAKINLASHKSSHIFSISIMNKRSMVKYAVTCALSSSTWGELPCA